MPLAMSTKNRKHAGRAKRSDTVPSNQVTLPGTTGSMKPERALALLKEWRDEGDADEDRAAYEAVLEEVERARLPSDSSSSS